MKNRQMQALLAGPDGLGTQLRAARGRLSMQKLADALTEITDPTTGVSKWTSSKVSKFEMGQQLPSPIEVELWAKVTGAGEQSQQAWLQLRDDAENKRSVYQRRTSVRDSAGSSASHLETAAALTRTVTQAVIPDLLQVEGYTRAVWATVRTEGEVDAIVDEVRQRQSALHSGNHRFQFLIGEGALRTIRGGASVMASQLDRLVSATSLDTVTIGIIPLSRPLHGPVIEAGFTLYDLDEAVVSDGVEDHRYGGDVAAKLRMRLDAAWEDAVQDRAARRLILNAIDALGLD